MSDELRRRLDEFSRRLEQGENARAIEEYLDRLERLDLVTEARRQSVLAGERQTADDEFWPDQADDRGWR